MNSNQVENSYNRAHISGYEAHLASLIFESTKDDNTPSKFVNNLARDLATKIVEKMNFEKSIELAHDLIYFSKKLNEPSALNFLSPETRAALLDLLDKVEPFNLSLEGVTQANIESLIEPLSKSLQILGIGAYMIAAILSSENGVDALGLKNNQNILALAKRLDTSGYMNPYKGEDSGAYEI